MFSPLFRNRVFLAGLLCLLLIVIGGALYLRHVQQQTDREFAHTEETTTPAPETQPEEAADTPDPQTLQEQDTDTANTPINDPVEMAWQRLDYISENIYEWGGIPSPKAPPLMEKLTPVRMSIDHSEAELRSEYLALLAPLRDPRSVEIIVKSMFEGGIRGRPLEEALVAIGPPSVPHLIPYLDVEKSSTDALKVADILAPISAKYRGELGGAVEHIILPKFRQLEAYFADQNSIDFSLRRVKRMQTAIEKIQE